MSSTDVVPASRAATSLETAEDGTQLIPYVTMTVGGQLFGLPAEQVEDAHVLRNITPAPLAPPEVAGVLNIRGNIVTAIDMARCLGLPPHHMAGENTSIVARYGESLYGLLVDEINDVVSLAERDIEKNPPTLDSRWLAVAKGVYRLEGRLMIITSVNRLLGFLREAASGSGSGSGSGGA